MLSLIDAREDDAIDTNADIAHALQRCSHRPARGAVPPHDVQHKSANRRPLCSNGTGMPTAAASQCVTRFCRAATTRDSLRLILRTAASSHRGISVPTVTLEELERDSGLSFD